MRTQRKTTQVNTADLISHWALLLSREQELAEVKKELTHAQNQLQKVTERVNAIDKVTPAPVAVFVNAIDALLNMSHETRLMTVEGSLIEKKSTFALDNLCYWLGGVAFTKRAQARLDRSQGSLWFALHEAGGVVVKNHDLYVSAISTGYVSIVRRSDPSKGKAYFRYERAS